MTYNILDGGSGRTEHLLAVLTAVQADIVLFQEVTHSTLLEEVAAQLGMRWFMDIRGSCRHCAVLSRFPLVQTTSYRAFPMYRPLLAATVALPSGQMLRLINVHLVPHYAVVCEYWRVAEVQRILAYVTQRHAKRMLIAGDFNAVAPGDGVVVEALPPRFRLLLALQGGRIFRWALARMQHAGWVDCYRQLHPDTDGFTLPTPRPHVRLDYLFATPAMAHHLKSCTVLREPTAVQRASDHYPVLVELDRA
jgi:exonuclease III